MHIRRSVFYAHSGQQSAIIVMTTTHEGGGFPRRYLGNICRGELLFLTRGTLVMAKKILIMDDDPTIADLLTEALADEGYETYMTTQSLRFYDAVREHRPDLVLLDIMMPYLDGRDELKLLAMAVDRQIPVIVVTAYLNAGTEESEFRQQGVVHIVYKPFDLEKLVELVHQ